MRQVPLAACVRRLGPQAGVLLKGILRDLQRKMGDGRGEEEEEGSLAVRGDEVEGFSFEKVGGVLPAYGAPVISLEGDAVRRFATAPAGNGYGPCAGSCSRRRDRSPVRAARPESRDNRGPTCRRPRCVARGPEQARQGRQCPQGGAPGLRARSPDCPGRARGRCDVPVSRTQRDGAQTGLPE